MRIRSSARAILFLIAIVIGVALSASAHAATFTVTRFDDVAGVACPVDDCSLRQAISAANANADADVIELPAGIYTLSLAGAGEDANDMGDLDIIEGTLTINGAAGGGTIIDANGGVLGDRAMNVVNNADAFTMNNVTIRNGQSPTSGGGLLTEG